MDPWYKSVELRREVREGRSFNPVEFGSELRQLAKASAALSLRKSAEERLRGAMSLSVPR